MAGSAFPSPFVRGNSTFSDLLALVTVTVLTAPPLLDRGEMVRETDTTTETTGTETPGTETSAGAGAGGAAGAAAHATGTSVHATGERAVAIGGSNSGIVVTGDHNVVLTHSGYEEIPSLRELPLMEAPVLAGSPPVTLFGREELVDTVVEELTAGHSVQLDGKEHVGKKAITDAVHARLAARGTRGHVLMPPTGEGHTLQGVYDRLARAFFGRELLREVDETILHAAVAEAPSTLITLIDCDLSREDLTRLLRTFPTCVFLITSPRPTLPAPGVTHQVQPLGRAAAVKLLSNELGLPLGPIGLKNLQFDHAYQETKGRPQRLLQYAEFIKASDDWHARAGEEPFDEPRETAPGALSPRHQAETLAIALSEPARQVLVALATFGTPLAPEWFSAVTGYPGAADAAPELRDRRLVTYESGAYRITEDAVDAVRAQKWARTDPRLAANGILALLDGPNAPELPDPYLLLAVARGLDDADHWATAIRFVRTAAPLALRAGRRQTALLLYALGKKAAGPGGTAADRQYFLDAGEHTRNLLEGDRAAVAAALAGLSLLAVQAGQSAAVVTGTTAVGVGKSAAAAAETKKAAGLLAKLTQTKAAVAAGAGAAAVGAATVVAVAVTGNEVPAGCAEVKQALTTYEAQREDMRTYRELADSYRRMASDLDAAAGKATDAAVRSAIRTKAADWNNEVAVAEQEDEDNRNATYGMHPDVEAALVGSHSLRMQIATYRDLGDPTCTNLLE